jgi:serine/threonine protein kinase
MTELQTGDRVRMQAALEELVVGERIGEGGQGAVYRANLNGRSFAVKWYRPARRPADDALIYASLAKLVESGRPPHPAFIWPIDMVKAEGRSGFGYVMPLMDRRFVSFAQMLSASEPPDFRMLIRIGLNLVDSFASLHTAGLCYRDINFDNLWVDPASGDVAIIDNDNVGTNGGKALVKGTMRFMAPEVMRDEALPSATTDLYSLALFLFYLFFFGHPLDGELVEASYSWDEGKRLTEEELMLKHFGKEPVFVFDPDNPVNRPVSDSPMWIWWSLYPRFFKDIFVRSFTTGITDPNLYGRLTEGVLRKGLYRLDDSIWECSTCTARMLYDPDDPGRACWNCKTVPPPPLLLTVLGSSIVLAEGAALTGRHLRAHDLGEKVLAQVEADASFPGRVLMRNKGDDPWTVFLPGEEPKMVQPKQRLLVRPVTLEIARKRVTIHQAGEKPPG